MPRKLGQHFLRDDAILQRLACAACGKGVERVIEIGPGRGALTRRLLPLVHELHAIELDRELAAHLAQEFSGQPKLSVHEADVLDTDLAQWGPAVVTGNLPYYITSPIVEKFLALDGRFEQAVFLMQWEVAQRLLAQPGSRDYGYLTVITQLACEPNLVARIPPSAFQPPPKVDSGAVLLQRRAELPDNLAELRQFASRCFAHKRKTLRNNLRPFYGNAIDRLPEAGLRAEQLGIEQLVELYRKLQYTESS